MTKPQQPSVEELKECREVDGMVNMDQCFAPKVVYLTTWLQEWAFQCGKCHREVVRYAMFGKPTCPFCKTKNVPPEFYGV